MVLYFCLSNSLTAAIQLMWRSARLRSFFRIPLPQAASKPSTAPSQGFIETFMATYRAALNSNSPPTVNMASKEQVKSLRKALRSKSAVPTVQ